MRWISKIFLFSILIISPLSGQESNAKISIKDTIELLMDLKKEINKSQLAFVQLARNMGQSGDLSLDDVLSADDDDLVE